MTTAASTRRILIASLVGTTVEFYDFYIYATAAALVFGPLFFPAESASVQLLSSYASLAVAFIARPVGAWVFGHYGDRIGRKSTLVASLMMMGGSTLAIAFLPTYATIGWWAPLILCVLRFGQGFGLGGEWGGAALLAVENAPAGWRGRYGMVPQLGAPLGFIAANGLFLLIGVMMTPADFMAWGWRVPFLLSVVLVGLGLWVRLRIAETPAFAKMLEEGPPPTVPMGELLRDHWRIALGGTFGAVACFAVYYIATAFALGYATTTLKIDRQVFLAIQLGAILFMGVGITLSGIWADRTSPARVLTWGCVGAIVAGFLLAPGLGSGSLVTIFVVLSFALLVMGFVYGPLGAWLPGLFPARVRYTGVSLSFNMAGILGGGLTPVVAQWLSQRGGGLGSVGLYLAAAAVMSLIALLALRPRRGVAPMAVEGP
ncbi:MULTISPECIES: MFS transporter [Sphingomonas]|uniref:MHS family MFS transporter n=3 Tax=Sphingomonas TaxID=13687 RepID=A0AA42CTI0_9SPHN|nr:MULTISPECIES: MFS transporter [Sphingomonas]MCW6529656.1 MHS family MFS transporter [Sphingomonas lycopersici]MCW6534423.1 MHS family MFS transporter [Sphingomonas lycopersici]